MDHDRPTHRSYNEKEIGALIQRATALHEEATGASEHTRSLSIEEVEHIASEMGLPPEHVRTAALELEDRVNSGRAFSVFGGCIYSSHTSIASGCYSLSISMIMCIPSSKDSFYASHRVFLVNNVTILI